VYDRAVISALNAALENTEDDLVENRDGRLSVAQAKRVRSATGDDAGCMTAFAIVFAGVLWSILGYLVYDGRMFSAESFRDAGSILAVVAVVLVAGVLPLAGVVWAVWAWIVHARTRPVVERAQGVIALRIRRGKHVVLHEVVVAGRTLAVTPRVHALLVDGLAYRFFVVPLADVVVAIEPVDAGG
jgi:hypothetical protein